MNAAKYFLVLIATSLFCGCNIQKTMNANELKIINNGNLDTPYSVLDINNEEDSVFLRKIAIDIPITNIAKNSELQTFIERLKLTMTAESGVGIAAPQVGIGRNLFLFMRIDKPEYPVQVAINPRIAKHSENTFCFQGDGCLSIPGRSGNTKRYEWVEVEYWNENGLLIKEKLNGGTREGDFTGIIFQHEYDHLQGILYIDRLCE